MNEPALAVEPPLRRVVRLLDRPVEPANRQDRQDHRPARTSEPAPEHDRTRPAHCRIAMQFED
ncbi:hypothetical protein ACPC54_35200 [Kitasatospora sp. NPDC094028]